MAYVVVEEGEEGADQIEISNIDKDSYASKKLSTDPY
jgi:hypothetical protein